MHCLRCRPYIHRSLISYPRNARFSTTKPQKSSSIPFNDSSRIRPSPTVIPSKETIENSGNLSSRLRQTTHHATTPPQPGPTQDPTSLSRKDLVAAQRRAERLSREKSRSLELVAGAVPSPSPLPRTPRNDLTIAQRRAEREARKLSESVAEVAAVPPASPPPRPPRDDSAIAQRRAEQGARNLSEEVAAVPSPNPRRRTPRNDSAIAQRRAERESHMLSESVAEAAEVVPLTSGLPRASRNNAGLAQRRAERERRETNVVTSGRSTGDVEQRLSSAATEHPTLDDEEALEAQDNLICLGVQMPQFRGAEEVSADLTDIFGNIPTSPSTGLNASPPKVQSTKSTKAYLLRRFAGDYTHYISGTTKVYTTTPDKLGAIEHAAHVLSRRQDVPVHLRQDALKIIQHATR